MIRPERINEMYKCSQCGELFHMIWGNMCNKCIVDKNLEELLKELK